jgi:branched-chain amino acid transport system permease protein
VLFFNNGVAGGVNRSRAVLAAAVDRYREGGMGGVVSFGKETVMKYVRLVQQSLQKRVRSIKRLVGAEG